MKTLFYALPALVVVLSSCVAPLPPEPAIEPPFVPPPTQIQPAQPEPAWTSPPAPQIENISLQTGWRRVGESRITPLAAAGAWLHEFSVAHDNGAGAEAQFIVFDTRQCALRVLDQPDSWAGAGAVDDVIDASGAIAGVNGGFFSPEFAPLGLMIAGGRRTGSWQANKLLTGTIAVTRGTPRLQWNSESGRGSGCEDFLQCGPRLVDAGRPMPTLDRAKMASRTFIAASGGPLWVLGTLHSSSLADLASILATQDLIPGLRIHRALNLDGGRSTALHARLADGGSRTQSGWSTVRNYVAITPRR